MRRSSRCSWSNFILQSIVLSFDRARTIIRNQFAQTLGLPFMGFVFCVVTLIDLFPGNVIAEPVSRSATFPQVESYESILNSAVQSLGGLHPLPPHAPIAKSVASLVAFAFGNERNPRSSEIFDKYFLTGETGIPSLKRYALRFASESGMIDVQSSVELVDRFITNESDSVKEGIDCAVYAFEAGAVFSPLNFSDLVFVFGKKHPDLLVTVLAKAKIPAKILHEVIPSLSIQTRNELARRLSDRFVNGTPDEIQNTLALFSNPADIPVDCASKFVLAAALINSEAIDRWLDKTDAKTRSNILNQIYYCFLQDSMKPIGEKITEWGLRSQNLLSGKYLLMDADSKTVGLIFDRCVGPSAVKVLASVAERCKSFKDATLRKSAFWYMNYIQVENEGFSSVIQNIENGVSNKDSDLTNSSISMLVRTNRTKAKAYLLESSDTNVRKEIKEQLFRQIDPREPNQDRQQLLNAKLDTIKSENEITDALKKRIEYLVQYEADYDRPTAITLLSKLPDGVTKEKTFGDFAKNWAKDDPVSASDWIATLPPSRTRDAAVSELVQASHDDPEVAFQNAAVIADVGIRRKAAISLIDRWKPLNPGAIATLLDASSMTVEDKAFLAEKLADKEQKGGKK